MTSPPLVAIIGRPNVGKSSLFNALTSKGFHAITGNRPGVTRDRNYGPVDLGGREVLVVDTGGFYGEDTPRGKEEENFYFNLMVEQVRHAIAQAHLVLLVVDGRKGQLPLDGEIARFLRREKKEFWIIVNKCDSFKQDDIGGDFFALGENIFEVSATHRRGIEGLKEKMEKKLLPWPSKANIHGETEREGGKIPQVAIMGGPNAGKSTLLNRLLGESRALVSDIPGTTVDSLEALGQFWGTDICLVDTPGIRKKRLITEEIEKTAVAMALDHLQMADIILYLIDIAKGIGRQDRRLIDIAVSRGRSVIVGLNKIDLVKGGMKREWLDQLPCSKFCSVFPLSAQKGKGIQSILQAVKKTIELRKKSAPTGAVNNLLQSLVKNNPVAMPMAHGKRLKVKYAIQTTGNPPTFLIFVNLVKNIPPSYRNYLKRGLQKGLNLANTPVKLIFKH